MLLNAVQLRSPPAALVHCALILNIDEWKILKIPRIPAANSLLPHFRASVYTNLFTLSIIIACSKIRSHYHHYREIITSRGIDWNTCFDFITDFWHCDTCHAAVSRGHAVTHYTRDIRDIVTIAGCGSLTGAGQWHMRPWCPLVSPLCLIVTTPVTVSITDSGMRSGIDPLFITQHPNPQWDIWKRWVFGESRVSVVTLARRLSLTLQRWHHTIQHRQQRPIIPSTIWGAQCQKKAFI